MEKKLEIINVLKSATTYLVLPVLHQGVWHIGNWLKINCTITWNTLHIKLFYQMRKQNLCFFEHTAFAIFKQ